jgi:hypothetical protein
MSLGIVRRNSTEIDALEEEIRQLEAGVVSEGGDPISPVESNDLQASPSDVSRESESTQPNAESPEEGNWKKRYSDLRRHTQKKETDFNKRIQDLEAKLASAPTEMPHTEEEIKAWIEKNPNATAVIRKIAGEKTGDIEKQVVELNKDKALQKILKKHPDFDELTSSDEFLDWADEQPEFIQNKIYDNDNPGDVIWAIDLYKQLQKGVDPNANAAKDVKTGRRTAAPASQEEGRFSESMIERNSPEWYEQNQEEITKALRNGTFVYDLSGGAR